MVIAGYPTEANSHFRQLDTKSEHAVGRHHSRRPVIIEPSVEIPAQVYGAAIGVRRLPGGPVCPVGRTYFPWIKYAGRVCFDLTL